MTGCTRRKVLTGIGAAAIAAAVPASPAEATAVAIYPGCMPDIKWERSPCRGCGAISEVEAEILCRPQSDETGERSCPGEFDERGFSINPTAASIQAQDAWIDRAMRAEEAATR